MSWNSYCHDVKTMRLAVDLRSTRFSILLARIGRQSSIFLSLKKIKYIKISISGTIYVFFFFFGPPEFDLIHLCCQSLA